MISNNTLKNSILEIIKELIIIHTYQDQLSEVNIKKVI